MRKCSYWFSLLSETEQKEYKANVDIVNPSWDFINPSLDFIIEHEEEDFSGFIGCGFIWEHTPQGQDYWEKISKRVHP